MAANRGVESISSESLVACERESEFSVLVCPDARDISSFPVPLVSGSVFCSVSPPPLREFQIAFEESFSVTFFSALFAFFSLTSLDFLPRPGNELSLGLEVRTPAPRCIGGSASPSSVIDVSMSFDSVGTTCPACIGMSSEINNLLIFRIVLTCYVYEDENDFVLLMLH